MQIQILERKDMSAVFYARGKCFHERELFLGNVIEARINENRFELKKDNGDCLSFKKEYIRIEYVAAPEA